MKPLPEIDISSVGAARKSLLRFTDWLSKVVLDGHKLNLAERAKLMIDNMRFMNAQENPVMRAKAEEAIAALREAVDRA